MNSTLPYLILPVVAFIAGFVDAIAGGGGLLTLPALLNFTPDVRLALGTNKGQSVFGSFASLVSFARAGRVHKQRAVPAFIAALLGSLAGVKLVLAIPPTALRPIVLALLVGVAVFFLIRKKRPPKSAVIGEPIAEEPPGGIAAARSHPIVFAALIGALLGTYDGFFGPGTGTFLIALHTAIFGDDLTDASANAKVSNFASNLGSVCLFAIEGKIDFRWALPMALFQMLGGIAGARAAIKGGERVVRTGVLLVTVALVVRLAWQMLQ
ncbi:MAG: TSUP family transporter [Polyangiaceae bacterium]|nr:TSUP family transporter [Polyangiaceae bacterium]